MVARTAMAKRAHKNITTQADVRTATTAGKIPALSTRLHAINTLKNLNKEIEMKYLVTLFLLAQLAIYARYTEAQVTNWDSSPLNYQNSPLNYQNSPLNYQNSPLNYQNSPLNYNSTNGVYDNNGSRIGYQTQSPSGVTNVFDNNGNRIGYSPSKRSQ